MDWEHDGQNRAQRVWDPESGGGAGQANGRPHRQSQRIRVTLAT
jgi:hypothetical protein